MVAHAVYGEVSLLAKGSARGAATARHVARGAAARAAGSIGRPATMVVAEAATHGGVVVVAVAGARRTIAVVVIVVAVAVGVAVVVATMVPVPVVVIVVVIAVAIGVSIVVVATMVPVSVIVVIVVMMISVIVMVAVAHGRVGLVEVMSGIEAAASMIVATLEGHEHCGMVEEHPTDTIAGVDGERPATGAPDDGTVEPLAGHEAVVLPGAEHIAQVAVAYFPPESEHVGAGIYVEQVVEVDLIHCLILCCCQSELVGHLVRKIKGLVACGVVRHCCGGDGYRHHHHQGHHLLHVFYVLMVELFFPFLTGKGKANFTSMKGIMPKLKGWFS